MDNELETFRRRFLDSDHPGAKVAARLVMQVQLQHEIISWVFGEGMDIKDRSEFYNQLSEKVMFMSAALKALKD